MAVPSFSAEGRMQERLRKLGCSEFSFTKIVSGIIGKNRIAEAFKDPTKCFDNTTAERLMEKILQMEELAQAVAPVPVDWSRADQVTNALTMRLAWKTQRELGIPDDLSHAAEWATKQVTNVSRR